MVLVGCAELLEIACCCTRMYNSTGYGWLEDVVGEPPVSGVVSVGALELTLER